MTTFGAWAIPGRAGPCSEIFYDHGASVPGGLPGTPEEDGDRFVEIWNLVFMQYDKQADGEMKPLPKPCIDTGSGLERLTAALQGVTSNFDIDLFRTLIRASEAVTGRKDPDSQPSHRVIADHLRTCAFLIAEGILPSNEGRGYVLRRIMRRALRHLHLLGAEEATFHRLVAPLVDVMGGHYQELSSTQGQIEHAFAAEEAQFRATLDRGLRILEREVAQSETQTGQAGQFSGEVAFRLYDTYGFPLDLTEDILKSHGLTVDVAAFDEHMAAQRERGRKAWTGASDSAQVALWAEQRERHGTTRFDGYTDLKGSGDILAIVKDGEPVQSIRSGDEAAILCDATVFYGESGGQVGDRGDFRTAEGDRFEIGDTQKPAEGLIVHIGTVTAGQFSVGDEVQQSVHVPGRAMAASNHSATHLLHAALRQVLGDHVSQKGSYVGPDRLRFDFSHGQGLSDEELERIERLVNEQITHNETTRTELMPLEEALETGAMAQFDEAYGDNVRVLSMGTNEAAATPFSVELCGGTHVGRLGDIGLFKIVSESSIGAGVRRVEALTNLAALDYATETERLLQSVQQQTKSARDRVVEDIAKLLGERKALNQEILTLREQVALAQVSAASAEQVGDVRFLGAALAGVNGKGLKDLARRLLAEGKADVVCLAAPSDKNVGVVVGTTKPQAKETPAKALLTSALEAMGGGSGGGAPDLAQGAAKVNADPESGFAAVKAQLATA